tara:strand:- start:46 stop:234 length:189 start_codon:yes stop_codon:yes gene_type:complete
MKRKTLDKILSYFREEAVAAPTNNIGGGKIAGSPEADPGNPPVRKKKRYIYQKGVRKQWSVK